jgi:hypothetical protein
MMMMMMMMMMMTVMKAHNETGQRRNMKMQSKELLKYEVKLEKGKMKEEKKKKQKKKMMML